MSSAHNNGTGALGSGPTCTNYDLDFGSDQKFRVIVIATTIEGTIAALRTASAYAANLNAKIELVAVEVVPDRLAAAHPAAINALRRRMETLVYASGIRDDELVIDVWPCPDRNACLRLILAANSLVLIGGKGRWWCWRERALRNFLAALGHQVIFSAVSYGPGLRPWLRGLHIASAQPKSHTVYRPAVKKRASHV